MDRKDTMIELILSDIIKEYLSECDVKKSSLVTYRMVLKQFIKYLYINKLLFNSIKRENIIEYKVYLKDNHEPNTVNLYISVVKHFYEWLEISGYYTNVARGIKPLKVPHNYKRLPLTTIQVAQLLNSIDTTKPQGLRNHCMINLMLLTGMRRIEVYRINVGDIADMNGKMVLKIWRKGHDAKDSYKVLSEQIINEIHQMLLKRDNLDDSDPLFISYSNESRNHRLTINQISTIVKQYLKKIGLTGRMYSAHSLRHTTAVTLIDKGYDLYYVQMFMGHSSPSTTQLYTKVISDRIALDDKGIKSLEKEFEGV